MDNEEFYYLDNRDFAKLSDSQKFHYLQRVRKEHERAEAARNAELEERGAERERKKLEAMIAEKDALIEKLLKQQAEAASPQ